MSNQLALAVQLNNSATLADFCWGNNALLQQQITTMLDGQGERLIYLWGVPGSGKSHLLQACCHALNAEKAAIYLPLKLICEWGPQSIENLEHQAWIGLDDIDAIAGNSAWEEALFHLYNRIRDTGCSNLIITGSSPPSTLPIHLPDLLSRLTWGLVIQLNELSDEDKIKTLITHANQRGFELSPSVGQFMIKRCTRNMHDLNALLDRLDSASLAAQRKIAIPFVKNTLGI